MYANLTWPLARLSVTADTLTLDTGRFGRWSFAPEQVVTLSRICQIPWLREGLRIEHSVAENPVFLTVWTFGRPDSLLHEIERTGFRPRAPASTRIGPDYPSQSGSGWALLAGLALLGSGFLLPASGLLKQPAGYWLVGAGVLTVLGARIAATVQSFKLTDRITRRR